MNQELDEQIVVRLPRSVVVALKRDGETNERTVAQTVRYAIRQYLGVTEGGTP